ncbi:MAG: DUF58 domain-containing protein [Phycisphaeraceae bacterium]
MNEPDPNEPIFDPAFLNRLRSLFLQLRSRRQLQRKGSQQTVALGQTRQFKDHRQYAHGDDYREIDWQLYARLDRFYIRQFEEIQAFHVHILLDVSASMTHPFRAKRVTALRLAAAMAYLGLIQQHQVSLLTMSRRVKQELPPIKGQGHVHHLLSHLEQLPFAGVTDLAGGMRSFRPVSNKRGIVVVISDLFGGRTEAAMEAMSHAGHWPAETHVIQVLHPHEIRPDLAGELEVVDTETQAKRRLWLGRRDGERYEQRVRQFIDDIGQSCARRGMNHVAWTTDEPFEPMLLKLLSRAGALGGG